MMLAAVTCTQLTVQVLLPSAAKLTKPDAHVVLPEIISKEPLGPVVRQGDDQWFNIVRWSLERDDQC